MPNLPPQSRGVYREVPWPMSLSNEPRVRGNRSRSLGVPTLPRRDPPSGNGDVAARGRQTEVVLHAKPPAGDGFREAVPLPDDLIGSTPVIA